MKAQKRQTTFRKYRDYGYPYLEEHLNIHIFFREFTAAVELKQVAQQEAEKARSDQIINQSIQASSDQIIIDSRQFRSIKFE